MRAHATARRFAVFAALALLAAPLAGCLGFLKKDEAPAIEDANDKLAKDILGREGQGRFDDLASAQPKNFTFPGQTALPVTRAWFNGTVGTEANLAHEGNRDQGGIDYNSIYQMNDIAAFVPPGQPVEVFLKLYWNAQEFNSMDLDIAVDLPGAKTSHYPAKTEDMNWNFATKTLTVNTVGVPGAPHLVGIQANSGRTTGPVEYSLLVEFTYAKDVLPPAVPYAFQVPANATGLILESVKAGGDEHITSEFIVIGPDDNLVGYIAFNDIAIPTESVFVPTNGAGEYVVYAFYMHGGFLSVRADAPLETLATRTLALVTRETSLDSSPSPGMIARDWSYGSAAEGTLVTPSTNAKQATFSEEGTHPLLVSAWLRGSATLASQVRVTSSKGLVQELTRALRYDDERGSIGYTGDEGYDNQYTFANIAKGAYTIDYVNTGALEVGVTVTTYQR